MNKIETIIKQLQEINNEQNHIQKYDLICALGGTKSILEFTIHEIDSLKFNNLIPINGLGFYKEYKNNLLMGVRQIQLLKFDYLKNEYIFKVGNEKSKEMIVIKGEFYPIYKDNYDNVICEITSI